MRWIVRSVIALLIAAILAVLYVAYPAWTLDRVWAAAKDGDLAALETFIDWSSVREGARTDARREELRHADFVRGTATFLGVTIGSADTDRHIGGVVTADVFSRVVRQAVANGATFDKFERSLRFPSPTTMVAAFRVAGRPEIAEVVLTLSGLTWRVTRLIVPENDPSLQTLLQSIIPLAADDPRRDSAR